MKTAAAWRAPAAVLTGDYTDLAPGAMVGREGRVQHL